MTETKNILVVEDEITNSILIKRILLKEKYKVTTAFNGQEALEIMENETFDAVLTDWMMPKLDGIELIKKIRENIEPLPLLIMITALVSEGAKAHALDSGADDYIAKPVEIDSLVESVKNGLEKKSQTLAEEPKVSLKKIKSVAPFPGVFIATSTGGPPTLLNIFKEIDKSLPVAYFIVQHGPSWMLDTFALRLEKESGLNVHIAENGMKPKIRNIYIAPGDMHIRFSSNDFNIILDNGPKENFVRPAADPLFRSAAETFGDKSIAVVLTGLGKDGSHGVNYIQSVRGKILIQDPETAIAPSMPNSAKNMNIDYELVDIEKMPEAIKLKFNEISG